MYRLVWLLLVLVLALFNTVEVMAVEKGDNVGEFTYTTNRADSLTEYKLYLDGAVLFIVPLSEIEPHPDGTENKFQFGLSCTSWPAGEGDYTLSAVHGTYETPQSDVYVFNAPVCETLIILRMHTNAN